MSICLLKEEKTWICAYKKAILLQTRGGTNLALPNEISVMVPRQKAVCCLNNNYKAILQTMLEIITWNETSEKKKWEKTIG